MEARRVRNRLEKEKARARAGVNIKHGPGGMLDVYFVTRYLQLRDNVKDDGNDRTTLKMLQCLRAAEAIDEENYRGLADGYELLRAVDHQLRLIVGRSATLPSTDTSACADIARRLNYGSAADMTEDLLGRMKAIRRAYEQIMEG
jgi:glutamate-ammonia-ligase adenylyltransferase